MCFHKSFPVAVWFSDLSSARTRSVALAMPLLYLRDFSGSLGFNYRIVSNNDADKM